MNRMPLRWRLVLGVLLLFSLCPPLAAAPQFYLVTYGPGPEVWERFGHNALWLYDETSGEQALYNFGFFDFEQRGFFVNFARGRMLYYAAATDPAREFPFYRQRGRSVEYQRLRLGPDQAEALAAELQRAVQPDQREYLYDYFLANCSTRVRDALDHALGGALQAASSQQILPTTFRRSALSQVQDDFLLYLGLQLGLGRPTDRPISQWEAYYLPQELATAVAAGGWSDPPVVYSSGYPWAGLLQPHWTAFAGLGFLSVALILLPWAYWRRRRPGWARLGLRLWFVFSGLAGTVLLLLWLATDHQAAWRNESLLLLNPLVFLLLGRKRRGLHRAVAAGLGFLLFAAFILKLLPGSQFNYDLLLWLIPAQATALALYVFSKFDAIRS